MSVAFRTTYIDWPTSATPVAAISDVNGDGVLDLIFNDITPVFRLGNGDGTFQGNSFPSSFTYRIPPSVLVANPDFNGDGRTDIVTIDPNISGSINLTLANGNGTFQSQRLLLRTSIAPPANFYPGFADGATSFLISDLNGDGRPDIVVNVSSNPNGRVFSQSYYAEILINLGESSTISGGVSNQRTNDNRNSNPFSTVNIIPFGDPLQTLNLAVTLDGANKGAFTNLSGGTYNASNGVYTLTGTATALTAAIDALVFIPTINHLAPGSSETTTFTIAVTDSSSRTVSDITTSVIATSVNDAPTITGLIAGQQIRDGQTIRPFARAIINDVDSPVQRLSVTIAQDDPSKGTLFDSASYFTTRTYSFSSASEANSYIQNLTFRPTTDHSTLGVVFMTGFTVSINDGITTTVDSTATVTTNASILDNAPTDFFGKGKSDILLQNALTGQSYVWETDGTRLIGSGSVGWIPGREWQAKGTGDFNGDGRADILLQNSNTGNFYIWEQNGLALVGGGPVGPDLPGPFWQEKGIGDFNGDGYSDILFQNINTGDNYIWELRGTTIVGGGPVGPTVGAEWQAKGTGDFNGDGRSDILFQNANTGTCYIWELNDTNVGTNGYVGWVPGAEWQVKGTGDFNGDGRSDIVLQNVNNGSCYIWELNGTDLIGGGLVGWIPGAQWNVGATGDYNGDGKSDILLQNTNSGESYLWELDGTNLIGSGNVGWIPGAEWQVVKSS